VHKNLYENEFNLHVNEIPFSYERMGTKTHFKKEAKGNSKTAYFYCTNKKHENRFDFGMLGTTNEMVYYFTDGIVITAELPLFYSSPS